MTAFVVLTFAFAWALWIPLLWWLRAKGRLGVVADDQPLAGIPWWVGVRWFLGASSPSLVALSLTARSGGTGAVGDLVSRLVDWDVGLNWNLVAWTGPLVVGLVAVAAHRIRTGRGVTLDIKRLPLMPVAAVAALPFGPLGEELGWRGFLLESLLSGRGALFAALLVGTIWAAWHVPVFWAPLGTTISGAPVTIRAVARFWLEVTAISVIMTWLFVQTAGSLWIAVGVHASWNAGMHRFLFEPFSDETRDSVDRWIVVGLTAVALILILWPGLAWRNASLWAVQG